jgi:hypothetical protein
MTTTDTGSRQATDHTPELVQLGHALDLHTVGVHESAITGDDPAGPLKLSCLSCETDLCSVEPGDTLPVLLGVWVDHVTGALVGDPR